MRVLFLDIDGVLNNAASLAEGIHLLPEKVLLVRRVCEETGAEVVISSSWRIIYDLQVLRELIYRAGGRGIKINDVTPNISNFRGHEIKEWLDQRPEVTKYAIIDDDADMLPSQHQYLVQTSHMCGITSLEVKQLIEILGD